MPTNRKTVSLKPGTYEELEDEKFNMRVNSFNEAIERLIQQKRDDDE